MILFKKIRWKNFLSTGNTFVEIELNKSQMTLMIGANGSGKSTMLDALTFALFNRPFRLIKKEQIVNTINNGDTLVELEFQIGIYTFSQKYTCQKEESIPYLQFTITKLRRRIISFFR